MSRPQPSLTIDVDVTNPGQFFACCGLLELAHRLLQGDAIEGWFDEGMFCIAAAGSGPDAFYRVFEGLLSTQIEEINARGDRTTHRVRLAAFGITLDWWIDDRGEKTPFKLWAGQQTSLRIVNDLRDALHGLPEVKPKNLFDAGRALTGRFGVDPRAAWNALDVGFSPNEQEMEVRHFRRLNY
jgi:CRISPR-associated protein Csx14